MVRSFFVNGFTALIASIAPGRAITALSDAQIASVLAFQDKFSNEIYVDELIEMKSPDKKTDAVGKNKIAGVFSGWLIF
jgi:hypothetical protein